MISVDWLIVTIMGMWQTKYGNMWRAFYISDMAII